MVHLASLPPIHGDPFDRMLVAQALQHGLTILTVDANFAAKISSSDSVCGWSLSH